MKCVGKIVGKAMKQSEVLKLPEGTHTVSQGLYLRVRGKYRNFFVRLQVEGKRRDIGLGSAYSLSLSDAKIKAASLKAEALQGRKDWGKKETQEEEKLGPLFKDYALYAFSVFAESRKWRGEKTLSSYRQYLDSYLLPVLAEKRMDSIGRDDVLEVLRPLWHVKTATASKVQRLLTAIFRLAIVEGVTSSNPASWSGNLSFYLPSQKTVHTVKHHPALTVEEAQKLADDLKFSAFPSHCAILFCLLTATRIGESVKAKWEEFDFEKAIWTIPPERRKDGKPEGFAVPLSSQALELLKRLPRRGAYVFQSRYSSGHVNLSYLLKALKKIFPDKTIHGCRSTFRDWCAREGVDYVLAEKCLMHAVGGAVYRAYQRDDLLEQRRPIMQRWADTLFMKSENENLVDSRA